MTDIKNNPLYKWTLKSMNDYLKMYIPYEKEMMIDTDVTYTNILKKYPKTISNKWLSYTIADMKAYNKSSYWHDKWIKHSAIHTLLNNIDRNIKNEHIPYDLSDYNYDVSYLYAFGCYDKNRLINILSHKDDKKYLVKELRKYKSYVLDLKRALPSIMKDLNKKIRIADNRLDNYVDFMNERLK